MMRRLLAAVAVLFGAADDARSADLTMATHDLALATAARSVGLAVLGA